MIQVSFSSVIQWFLQEGPDATKHKEWSHPIVTFIVHYIVVIASTFFAHDMFVDVVSSNLQNYDMKECAVSSEMIGRRKVVGRFLAMYFLFYFFVRLALQWKSKPHLVHSEFYQQTFMCSVTIANSAISFYYNRPIISQAFCVVVGIDQLLWYFDIVGFLLLGTFPIGVCKYLFKPDSTWIYRITSSHHLWTIPLVLWASGGIFHWLALPLSFVIVPISVFISHSMIPVVIRINGEELYLNINLSHEMWTDVKFGIFLIGKGKFPYALRLCCWWYILNILTFAILYGISKVFKNESSTSICDSSIRAI